MLGHLFELFFPDNCAGCKSPLFKNEHTICTKCLANLPYTDYINYADNPVAKIFWGKLKVEAAASYLHFTKTTTVQKLLHELKYKGNKQVGHVLGYMMGKELLKNEIFGTTQYVIPIPLHPKKERKRGYNQAWSIAQGIAHAMNIEALERAVVRNVYTESQTKKTRFKRWQNVESIFSVKEKDKLKHQHIILVDDVITTGSTMEACLQEIIKNEGTKVSVAALASA
jgi:ComF family protein